MLEAGADVADTGYGGGNARREIEAEGVAHLLI